MPDGRIAMICIYLGLLFASTSYTGHFFDSKIFDPLNEKELTVAANILRKNGLLGHGFYLQILTLKDPSKDILYATPIKENLPREAKAVVVSHDPAVAYQCIINLSEEILLSVSPIKNGQPALMKIEADLIDRAIRKDLLWQAAMLRRGIQNFKEVHIENWGPGDTSSIDMGNNHRVFRSVFYLNGYALSQYERPIEGISTITDVNDGFKITVVDTGIKPLPAPKNELSHKEHYPLLEKYEPNENVVLHGHQVNYRQWQFHAAIHPREGLVISRVGFNDRGRLRSILHRASMSEMIVPYADTDDHWYWKAAFDQGEYGLGNLTSSLISGIHAPAHAHYLDAVMTDNDGKIKTIKKAMAIFERDSGMLWSHHDGDKNQTIARAGKEVVVVHFVTVGNYDYGTQWIFKEDGTIELQMLLTGIIAVKATELTSCARCQQKSDPLTLDDRYGSVVDTNLLGISHQHFFNFRLDFAIDGANNQVAEIQFERVGDTNHNPQGNAFIIRKEIIASEKSSARNTDEAKGRRWLIYNPNHKNRLGHFPGYMLYPGQNASLLAQDWAHSVMRAPFLKKSLYVTAYHPDELHAAGDFPSQSQGDGVAHWIERNASLINRSVVVWYTFGATHLPCAEEWPIMPVSKAGFQLRPMGFFEENPALSVNAAY